MKTRMGLLMLAAIVLVVAACGGASGETATVADQPATRVPATAAGTSGGTLSSSPTTAAAVAGSGAAAPTTAPAVEAVSEEAVAEEDLTLPDLSVGQDELDSYKTQLVIRSVGKDAQGAEVTSDWELSQEFTREPSASRYYSTSTSSTAGVQEPTVVFEMITVGDTAYWITEDPSSGETTCMVVQSSDTAPQEVPTPDAWGGISGYKYVNTETVNSVRAKHYAWKEDPSAPVVGLGTARGETWIAIEGGFVVRYEADLTGQSALFAPNAVEGSATIEYDLTEANAGFEILPPEGCESAASDVPILSDARDKTSFGDFSSYQTSTAFADVVGFYREEMPNSGWAPSGTPTEMEGFATFEFKKDTRTAQITITSDGSGSVSVMISITKE